MDKWLNLNFWKVWLGSALIWTLLTFFVAYMHTAIIIEGISEDDHKALSRMYGQIAGLGLWMGLFLALLCRKKIREYKS